MIDKYSRLLDTVANAVAVGNFVRALDAARELSAANAGDRIPARIVAQLLYMNGDTESALPLLRRMMAHQTGDHVPAYLLGHHARARGLDREAEAFESEGLRLARNSLGARMMDIASSDAPLLLGPWLGEPEMEVLYWIPFLRKVLPEYGIAPERCIAVSYAGASGWYEGLAGRSWDLSATVGAEAAAQLIQERVAAVGVQAQATITNQDAAVVKACSEALGIQNLRTLHPAVMYDLLQVYWTGAMPLDHARAFLAPYPSGWRAQGSELLPPGDVVSCFYARPCFGPSPVNENFANSLAAAAGQAGRSLLDMSVAFAREEDNPFLPSGTQQNVMMMRAEDISPEMAHSALAAAIGSGSAYMGTYGVGCYLALAQGLPAYGAAAGGGAGLARHTRMADALLASDKARLHVHDSADWDMWQAAFKAGSAA